MKSRRTLWTVLGVVAIVGFLAFGFGAFKSNLTPYVTFEEARTARGTVQITGTLVSGSDSFDADSSRILFTLRENSGDTMRVAYAGAVPGNLKEADMIVAIGRFDGSLLQAEGILTKCPSKYEQQGSRHPDEVPKATT
ncbi:MAG: cytochrome c maturation protein CcmE [Thermoanaerobaculaceae bacterium]|nr:cytochrome c maturation protein CcmE [Thermoanaerobaculaceae bacterium]MDI9621852.1 cytochrome c maturation protein CcmE [Acidobacteriota bacterium]HPW54433.1 cytochrome c maturation protein CcmE [Thermoanaerobaculaceae bacterium]